MESNKKKRQDKKRPAISRQSSSGSMSAEIQVLLRDSVPNQALFLQKIYEASEAVNKGDFHLAIQAYTEAILLDPRNHILYTNRSIAFVKIQQYQKSLLDAKKSRELNPKWAKAYIQEGTALQQLGKHADALAAFASGLAQDINNAGLLSGLKEAALKCPLKEKLEQCFQKMQLLDLDKSPFVIISVIGQELLQAGHYHASTQMLKAALEIGTCSQKLRSSVVSALSSAYWGLGNMEQAIAYMQKDLQVAKNLGDVEGQCRAYGNLGSAYFTKGHYKEALSHDRFQLVLAMQLKDRHTANVALSRLGHVYTAIGDYPNALQSHKQCVLLLKQINDKLAEAREIGNVGAVYLAMGNFDTAIECHLEHLKIAKGLKNSIEEARAFSNLGSAYHYKRNYEKAILYHKQVLKIAEQKCDKSLEARAYAGLGHAARCMQDYGMSKMYHEKQLDNALQTRDKVAEGRACANLGIIFHQLGEYEAALKLHNVHLSIAKDLGDYASQGRALGNIGNAYCALNKYDQAIKYHKQELAISTEVNDRHSEGSTHGNLAVAYQTLKMYDSAHQHYVMHLNISRELKDSQSEARAVCNLGNFHSSRGEYTNSIPYYEQYLMLSQELHDSEGEAKACFCLGYAHFALSNFQESVRYYQQDLSIAQELKNQLGIARAYCNLGLAHKALNNFPEALDCQKKCLNLMTSLKNVKGKFRSLGNIGDVLLKTGDACEAIKFYNQQLQLAKQSNNQNMLALANSALGAAHRTIAQYDKALGFHTQELSLRQDMSDLKGECRAHGNLGSVHMCLGKYMNAYKCYEEQLEKSRELQDNAMEANACGNLAITKMNMGNFEEAIGLFEQQLAILEQVHGNNAMFDKGCAFGNLGDCYEALGDFEESIKYHEQYLAIAQSSGHLLDQDRAYRGLGNAHRSVGNLQQALVCFEKRLVVAHELNSSTARASAYGELGCLHSLLGNFEQAILCLQHQLAIAREMNDSLCEGDAACGLGGVYQQMGEYERALEYHEMDLKIAENTKNTMCQCRAYGNLGLSHESLGEYTMAIRYQEQHLSIAAQMNDRVAKTLAYSSLGRVHHALNNRQKAVEYLRQGLQIAEQLGRMEDEAKIRHRLGLALWGNGDYNECQLQLYKASELFESIRRSTQFNSEYKLSLFDLQTACYQALQRVLVSLDRHQEALVVAERACTRAFIDLLMERQAGSDGFFGNHVTDPPPITLDQITNIVQKQKSMVLYFSVAMGFLYGWLLTPIEGIVKYHVTNMMDVENEVNCTDNTSMKSSVSYSACSLLDNMVGQIHEFMSVDTASNVHRGTSRSMSLDNDGASDVEDHWERNMEELGDKLNAENDRTGFLRIVNRNHIFNSSNYSLGSLLSLNPSLNASLPDTVSYRKNSARNNKLGQKSVISALYQLLIEPFEEAMKEKTEEAGSNPSDLILVLQGDLYLIPFSMLRKDQTMEYLFERFNLIVVPSLTSLQSSDKHQRHGRPVIDSSGAVVVGNPKLTPAICQHWHLHDIPASECEAQIVGEILTARPLIGHEATKVAVLNQIEQVEVIHFVTHISWKLSSVILSPGEVPSHTSRFPTIDPDDGTSDISSFDGPSLAEYLLTAADILNLKLHAKLVVLSAGYTNDQAGHINTDGVVGLTRSLLSAGAQCVLYCLWPIPDQASKLLMRTLYLGLQEGKCISQALTFAVKMVQSSKQYSHPSNWGGWVLIGQDVKLSSKVAQMGHAICELLQNPSQCREAMRVLLHLIEKSLQRIHQGAKNSMYTMAQSIENKVGGLSGWKDLLQAVGFRFEPSLNGLPPAVFFPQSDPGDRLTQASASLQSLLGLPQGCLQALPKFFHNYEAGEAIIRMMRDILSRMVAKDTNMDVKVNVKLWRISGCHEFVASLCMDLVEVGDNEITLHLGKQASKRQLQCALQSLVTIFDTLGAPLSLHLDSSSSLESLSSSHSGSTSTSNFSKGSTPPLSPQGKRKSLFNPAEMEKLRIRNSRMSQGGLAGRKIMSDKSQTQNMTDPATCLQYQNQIKFMYRDGRSMSPQDSNAVSVMAFSDSDTTTSPILGGSANSDKMREIQTAELYSLSFDACSDKRVKGDKSDNNKNELCDSNDRKSCLLPEVLSARTNITKHESVENYQETEEAFVYVEDESFQRNGENRTSDISNNSSISQGIQADKDSRKRNSDLSDMSANSNGYLTPKHKKELDKCIPLTDESGIVSETASCNQNESSQQSDLSNFQFDPAEIAKKIMSDVSEHKIALDSLQKLSVIQSQTESNFFRSVSERKSHVPSTIKNCVSKSESILHNSSNSTIAAISGNAHSAFISLSHTSLPPSLMAVKSALSTNTSNFQSVYANMDSLVSIPNLKPSFTDNTIKQLEVTFDNSEHVVTRQSTSNMFQKTAVVVNKTNCISSSTSVSAPLSFSTFRPNRRPILADCRPIQADSRPVQADSRPIQTDGRPIQADGRPIWTAGRQIQADCRLIQADNITNISQYCPDGRPIWTAGRQIQADCRLIQADNITNISQYCPESTTSTSSYCSTPSSLQSIIYQPHTENHAQDSPCTDPSDSHSAQVIDRESLATAPPNANECGYNVSTIPSQKRDSSPALSSSSSASVRNGKQKKKVSFSDSEPSDTPSPLDSSANSNTLSYFEIKRYNLGPVPAKSPSACRLLDSNGIIKTAPQILRSPPSYQYAIRNSQYIVNKSEEKSTRLPSQSQSSSSSFNNFLDEIDCVTPQEILQRRYVAGTLFQDNSAIKNKTNLPLQQQQMKCNGTVTQNNVNINTNYQFQNMSISSVNQHMLQGHQSQGHMLQDQQAQNHPSQGRMLQGQQSQGRQSQGWQSQGHQLQGLQSQGHQSQGHQSQGHSLQAADTQPASFAPELPPRGIAPIPTRPNDVPSHQPASRMQASSGHQGSVSCISPTREKLLFQTQTVSHSGSLNTDGVSSEQIAPNFTPFSSTRCTVLRHPLSSMKSQVSQTEHFPRPLTQFQISSESHGDNIHQPDYGQSMEVLDQYNHYEPFKQLQNYKLKAYSGTQVLNHYSPHLKEMTIPATNQKQVQQINHYATTNLLPLISECSNTNEQSPRRNCQVPPVRMDGWENMNQCINGHPSGQRMPDNANGQSIEGYGEHGQNIYSASFVPKEQNVYPESFVPNTRYYSNNEMPTQNGFLRDKIRNVSQQMYDSSLMQPIKSQPVQPIRSNIAQLPHKVNITKGNVSNLLNNLTSFSQSRPVGTGSDKRCFARTNVIQPSKC